MKTEVIMYRPFLTFQVRQMSKCEFLNCNDALKAVNVIRIANGKSEKRLDKFFENDHSEYLEALCKYLNQDNILIPQKNGELKPTDLIIVKKGRYGGTWLHPYYYTKFARWLSPEFEAAVDIWITDNLLMFRNNGGDSFKFLNRILDSKFEIGSKYWEYAKVAKFVQITVFGHEGNDLWNFANQEQLAKRERILIEIEAAAKYGNFSSLDDLLDSVEISINK